MDRVIVTGNRYELEDVIVAKTLALDTKAELAAEMLVKWGMVMGLPDGEDAAGRQKLKLMPVDELVQRACETAEEAFKEFEKRGWLLDIPVPKVRERVSK